MARSDEHHNIGDILAQSSNSNELAIIEPNRSGGPAALSRRQLHSLIQKFAALLSKHGLSRGSRVAIMSENSIEYVIAYFGVMYAGLVCVPVNFKQNLEIITHICQDAEVSLLLAAREYMDLCPPGVDVLDIALFSNSSTKSAERVMNPAAPDFREPALILYTSGSTGVPKGVVLSHDSQIAMYRGLAGGRSNNAFSESVGIIAAPMYHMNALAFLGSVFSGGGAVVILNRFEPESFMSAIEAYGVTVVTGVPTMMARLAQACARAGRFNLSSVRLIVIGSAPLSKAVLAQIRGLFPQAKVVNSYGTTETGGGLFGDHPEGVPRPEQSIGYPRPHVNVRIDGRRTKFWSA